MSRSAVSRVAALAVVAVLIAAFCIDHGLTYTETSLFASYAQALSYLNQVGKATRLAPA